MRFAILAYDNSIVCFIFRFWTKHEFRVILETLADHGHCPVDPTGRIFHAQTRLLSKSFATVRDCVSKLVSLLSHRKYSSPQFWVPDSIAYETAFPIALRLTFVISHAEAEVAVNGILLQEAIRAALLRLDESRPALRDPSHGLTIEEHLAVFESLEKHGLHYLPRILPGESGVRPRFLTSEYELHRFLRPKTNAALQGAQSLPAPPPPTADRQLAAHSANRRPVSDSGGAPILSALRSPSVPNGATADGCCTCGSGIQHVPSESWTKTGFRRASGSAGRGPIIGRERRCRRKRGFGRRARRKTTSVDAQPPEVRDEPAAPAHEEPNAHSADGGSNPDHAEPPALECLPSSSAGDSGPARLHGETSRNGTSS
jgi:hypothetical protein